MEYQPNDYGSLGYVDHVGSNYLFRGGAPLTSVPDPDHPGDCIPDPNDPEKCLQVFDYAGLTRAIASAPNLGCVPPPPSDYYLVIVDLVHANEVSEFEPAMNYFNDPKNPARKNLGQVNLWDTNGTPVCYFNMPENQRAKMVATIEQWLGDPLVWRAATIRSWLEDATQVPSGGPAGVPIVIYVHCDGGCDRTGEMIGAYRLRYMNGGWTDVWGDQPCGRPLGCNNYRALQWYAFWLNQTQGFQIHYIGLDGGCTDNVIHRICSRPDEVPINPPVD